MAAPGVYVTRRDNPAPASAPTDSSVKFVTGITQKGPVTPQLIESLDELVAVFGARVSYGMVYDDADAFFREGGSRVYVARVVGPAAVRATHNFLTAGATVSLIVTARDYGDWANTLNVAVTQPDGAHFVLTLTLNGVVVEVSPVFASQAEAAAWVSSYVTVAVGGGAGIPAVAASNLAGGTDDHASAVEAQWTAALATFPRDLGPGQVSAPGRTTDQAHLALLAHAQANNRFALLDPPDTGTVATLTAAAAAARTNGEFGALWAPWAVIPGVVDGTFRKVPWSSIQAGIIARNDSVGDSPNIEAAGVNGVARYAIDVSQAGFTDLDRATLNDAGVNVARVLYSGAPRAYGERTLADPAASASYREIGEARLVMEITAQADVIAERYAFAQLDGRGHTFGEFAADLGAMLAGYWTADSLYGATQDEAFTVDVGAQVNTPQTIAARELNAQITLRISPGAEVVQIYITKRPVTEGVN